MPCPLVIQCGPKSASIILFHDDQRLQWKFIFHYHSFKTVVQAIRDSGFHPSEVISHSVHTTIKYHITCRLNIMLCGAEVWCNNITYAIILNEICVWHHQYFIFRHRSDIIVITNQSFCVLFASMALGKAILSEHVFYSWFCINYSQCKPTQGWKHVQLKSIRPFI